MLIEEIHNVHSSNLINEISLISAFLLSLTISYIIFPKIIYLSLKKNLVSDHNERSSHIHKTPTLGGISIFIGIMLTLSFYCSYFESKNYSSLSAALIILFFMGVKDDILIITARKKFFGQIIAALIVIIISDVRIKNLHGLLGIEDLNYSVSVVISIFIYIFMINAYNLIDGIDGLAGSIGILFSLVIGTFFYFIGKMFYSVISFSLMGTLLAFLYYNFSKNQKIFMGDTGSMIVGFLISYLSILFISNSKIIIGNLSFSNLPIVVLSLFFYPLIDTIRIFSLRLFILKKSPFLADNNHLHHRLLSLRLKHKEITFLISCLTLLLFLTSLTMDSLNINIQFTSIIALGITYFSFPFILYILIIKKNEIKTV
jgi:UDP-N-acetylmuramyl pentapeptide phosphotransferase/UDP-N-acetylglucosamine-1-phosphate transferase